MFVITPEAFRASCCSFSGAFPWETPQAVAACGGLSSVFILVQEVTF